MLFCLVLVRSTRPLRREADACEGRLRAVFPWGAAAAPRPMGAGFALPCLGLGAFHGAFHRPQLSKASGRDVLSKGRPPFPVFPG